MVAHSDPAPVKSLGPLELQLIRALWDAPEPLSVQGVVESLGPGRNYKTVMTVLNRLVTKGVLDRELDGRAYRYHARQARADFLRSAADELVQDYVASYGDGAADSLAEAVGVHVAPRPEQQAPPSASASPVAAAPPRGGVLGRGQRAGIAAFLLAALGLETALVLLALNRWGSR